MAAGEEGDAEEVVDGAAGKCGKPTRLIEELDVLCRLAVKYKGVK